MVAMFHFKLCKAILIGFRDQLKADGTYKDGFVGLVESGQESEAMAVMSVQIAPEIVDDKVYRRTSRLALRWYTEMISLARSSTQIL